LGISTQRKQIRVLQVLDSLGMGGAETWMIGVLEYLSESRSALAIDLQVDFCLTGSKKGVLEEQALLLGATIHRVPFNRNDVFAFVGAFRGLLKNNRYDVIHDHQDFAAGFHFVIGLGHLPAIRITHAHNPLIFNDNYANSASRKMSLMVGKFLSRVFTTAFTATSDHIIDQQGYSHPNLKAKNCGAAYCGFDVTRFSLDHCVSKRTLQNELMLGDSAKFVLFAGRLDTTLAGTLNQKNPRFALEVAIETVNRCDDIVFIFAGGGEDGRREMDDTVRRLGLCSRIRTLGVRKDIELLMSAASCLLFPSFAEGLGMVAVESQAAGTPVLTSEAVPRECVVLKDLVTFLPLADGVCVWSKHLEAIVRHERIDGRAANDAARQSPFSIENSVQRLLDLYGGNETNEDSDS
jgi:glycosyltransferase EpsF